MASPHPEITIVIPVRNRAGIVGRTLESIRLQSLRPLAVILVDNNSTDNTTDTLLHWKASVESPDLQITVISEPMEGAPAARNRGLQLVTTPYVMFFDSDDTMEPRHVERAMKAFHDNPSLDITGWDIGLNLLDGTHVKRRFKISDLIWHCIMHGSMSTQRYAVRTSLIRNVGGWDKTLPGWNDIELGIRLILQNPVISKTKGGVTVETFSLPQSITGTAFSLTPMKWEMSLDKIECTLPIPRTRRYVQLRRAILAGEYAREGAHNEASRLMNQLLSKERCPFYRTIYRLAKTYRAHGGRGVAMILRPLF